MYILYKNKDIRQWRTMILERQKKNYISPTIVPSDDMDKISSVLRFPETSRQSWNSRKTKASRVHREQENRGLLRESIPEIFKVPTLIFSWVLVSQYIHIDYLSQRKELPIKKKKIKKNQREKGCPKLAQGLFSYQSRIHHNTQAMGRVVKRVLP